MCRPPPAKGRRRPWHWLIYLCVCVGILPAGSGGEQAEEVKCLPINFFLLDAPEFTAIKINLCESGLSLQDLVTFACLHIKFNNPVCESNHSLNNRFNLGCHLSVGRLYSNVSAPQTCCSVNKSCPTLRPHELQHARLPCPSPSPRACSNSCPSSW